MPIEVETVQHEDAEIFGQLNGLVISPPHNRIFIKPYSNNTIRWSNILQLNLNGSLRLKKKAIALTICSAPLARILVEKKINYVDITYAKDTLKIKPGTTHKVHFERLTGSPLIIIYVSKVLPIYLANKVKENLGRTIKISALVEQIINENGLVKYKKSIRYVIPAEGLELKANDICEFSGHVTKINDAGPSYQLRLKHKIFERIAENKAKILIFRKNNLFCIKHHKDGITLNLYKDAKGHPMAYAPIPPILVNDSEKTLFDTGRRSIKSRVCVSPSDFNLELYNLFLVREERDLAKELIHRGIKVSLPDVRIRSGDLLLKENNAQIEITTIMPNSNKQKNGPHGSSGAHINARICEAYLRTKVLGVKSFFVILNQAWADYTWINDLIELIEPNVKVLFTNFTDKWQIDASKEIVRSLR